MKAIVYLFVGLFCSIHAVAQEEPKFGQVPDEDVMMTVYAEDSSAEAVILGDYGVAYFTYLQSSGFMLKFERHTIIKILTKDGYKWADHEVGLYHNNGNNENFSGLKGFTYNYEDGKVVKTKLEKASVFREERNEYWDLQKFTMPDVKEGSVIEYTYSISSDFDFNLRSWQFQYDIPVRWSEYRTDVPEYFQYRKVTQGYHGFVINENTQKSGSLSITSVTRTGGNGKPISSSYQSNNVHYVEYSHRLAAQNVPAMRPEAFVASIDNYVQKIDYELQSIKFPNSRLQEYRTTWAKLNEEFDEHINFGQQLNNVFFLRNEIEAIGLSAKSDEEKIMLAFQLVRKNVAWNGYYSKYVTSGLKQAYDDKAGTVADINLLLTAILRKLELKADPVLVSTRQNGLVRENFPISSQFNYVICAVNMGEGGTVLLDATDRVIPIGYLPERCLNDKGWRVSKDGGGWVNLVPSKGWKRAVQATFDIGDEGKIAGDYSISFQDYASFNDRRKLIVDGDSVYVKEFKEKNQSWNVSSYSFENVKDELKPLIAKYNVEIEGEMEDAGELIFFTPLLSDRLEENPFKIEKRVYPVDFTYPRYSLYSYKYKVPEGFEVDELPEPKSILLPDRKGMFVYNVSVVGDEITVTSLLDIRSHLFLSEEYPYLKEFYSQVVEKQAEQIVLKKKS